jgi:hypothetical protein
MNGAYVLVKNTNLSKMAPTYSGPYQIVASEGNTYTVAHLGTGKTFQRSVHALKPFLYNPSVTNPQEIAAAETGQFLVEAILKHKGRGHNRTFQVKWLGYDDPKDFTWEPISHLKNNFIFHDYCIKKGIRDLIPPHLQHQLQTTDEGHK